jgi:glycosyltransferase involved in cell wall biosynthesis
VRIGLITDGGYPYATGEYRLWCDRLVRGLADHEFDVYALSRSAARAAQGLVDLPPQVRSVHTAPLWAPVDDGRTYGRRERRRFAEHFGQLALGICDERADSFAVGLHGLAELAVEHGGLCAALRSETAVRILESACRAPGARRSVREADVLDLLTFARELERALRPLSLDWYGDATSARDGAVSGARAARGSADGCPPEAEAGTCAGLAAVDICHTTTAGPAALAGLLAKRFFGVPLLVTEYDAHVRAHYLATDGAREDALSAPVRALLAAFHGRLAAEVYRAAQLVTPGNAHARRWQERCGADRARLRTVHPGMDADRFAEVGEADDAGDPDTLVWVGRIEPAKDLVSLLHAFSVVHERRPGTRLRVVGAAATTGEGPAYLSHCRTLAAQLFPDEAPGAFQAGENPVSFEEVGGPEAPELPDAYAGAAVVVLSSSVEGFPVSLVEAMFCGRATVSTDVGAVVEVVGGTGLVVPPHNPKALAEACLGLLADDGRRRRLGAAARSRALELFSVEQNVAAFRAAYLDILSHSPGRHGAPVVGAGGAPLPFATTAEVHVPVRWADEAVREQVGAGAPAGDGSRDV